MTLDTITKKINNIKLEKIYGSEDCEYSIIENDLVILYENQEKILTAIKLLNENLRKK